MICFHDGVYSFIYTNQKCVLEFAHLFSPLFMQWQVSHIRLQHCSEIIHFSVIYKRHVILSLCKALHETKCKHYRKITIIL